MEIYSPGGMADGIAIQDRDPLSVPSTRRNPLVADIFERLGYMERKGSGFGKILDAYEFQVNYKEDKKPSFRSDRASFFTIMPNLNYEFGQSNTKTDQTSDQTEKIAARILSMVRQNPEITQIEIANVLGFKVGKIKEDIGKILRKLCQQKGAEIIEAELCPDHIHMLVSIPPKISVSSFAGFLKGKSSLMIFDRHANLKYKYGNRHFWCRGYYVNTVGRNKKAIAEYIRNQLQEDIADDQISLKEFIEPFTGDKKE